MTRATLRAVLGYFLRGTLVVVPLAVTAYILWLILSTLDQLLPLGIPGLGLFIMLVAITLVGFATTNVVGRTLVDGAERLLARVPLVKLVYSSIKDLIGAFVGDKRRFDRPVAVSMTPGGNVKLLGFVTRDGLGVMGMPQSVAVYFPQSYNFAGNVAIVPKSQVEALDVSSGELMTFVVSGGVSGFGIGQSMTPGPTAGKTQIM
jgi:uncharacterized membrane protein